MKNIKIGKWYFNKTSGNDEYYLYPIKINNGGIWTGFEYHITPQKDYLTIGEYFNFDFNNVDSIQLPKNLKYKAICLLFKECSLH